MNYLNKDNLVMWLHEEYFSCLSIYSETGYPVSGNQNCVTFLLMHNNNHRHSGLKQHTFIISQFLWVRISAQRRWSLCSGFHQTGIKVSIGV